MKLKSILLIALFLLPTLIQAQSEQLQREIRIAEGILQELFQENLRGESPFIAFSSNRVTSDYIPGYGVHFLLGSSLWTNRLTPAGVIEIQIDRDVRSGENRSSSVAIRRDEQHGNDDSLEVTYEELEKRMTEYFTQYASLLRHLPENEYIRLSTGLRSPATRIAFTLDQGTRNIDLPKITKWVNKSRVLEFERGLINENQFIQQIQSADLSEVGEKRDFTIFKSILDTAVREANFEHLRIRSSSDYTYLPDFGIQFNITAGTRGLLPFNVTFAPHNISNVDLDVAITRDRERVERHRDELEREIDSIRRESGKVLDSLRVAIEDVTVSLREAFAGEREQPDPELLESEKELLYDEITQAMREYGSTLSSLSNDEFIIVSVNWSARDSTLPERTYIRLKKSELSTGNLPDIQEVARR